MEPFEAVRLIGTRFYSSVLLEVDVIDVGSGLFRELERFAERSDEAIEGNFVR